MNVQDQKYDRRHKYESICNRHTETKLNTYTSVYLKLIHIFINNVTLINTNKVKLIVTIKSIHSHIKYGRLIL